MKQNITKCMTLVTVILMDILTGMEFDLFVPSFPQLQTHFSVTPFWLEAILSANFAGYCLSLFFVGGLADRYGRKPIIILGLIFFVIGSMCCLWAPSYYVFLVGRFLQGAGVAAPAILSFLIVADTYALKQQQFLLSMLNGSLNIAAAAAPVIGSFIALYFHWQGNFWALLLLGMITLVMSLYFIPTYQLPEKKESISWRGYIPIFQSKTLMLMIILFLFMFPPYWIFVGMSPLLYMKGLGVSLSHFGYYQGSLALIFAVGSIVLGLVINNFNSKKMLSFSNNICIFSFICIVYITVVNSANPLFITLAFIPFIISQIIPSNILFPVCLHLMPQAKGRINAILQGGRLIFTSISLQIAGFFYTGSFRSIGIIIAGFIFMVIIMQSVVIKNEEIMKSL